MAFGFYLVFVVSIPRFCENQVNWTKLPEATSPESPLLQILDTYKASSLS